MPALAEPEVPPNPRHLNGILVIAECGSLTAAARRINLSQPALTQAVAGLEARLGVPIFTRARPGMVPTEPGRVFLERIRRGIGHLRRAGTMPGIGARLHRVASARQIRALVATVELGGFGAAARALRRELSTVSRACRDLERLTGTTLFEATSSGLHPTRQAEELARLAKLALAEFAQAFSDVDDWRGNFRGRLAVGCLPLAQSALLPQALCRFAAEYPQVSVQVVDGYYASLARALRRGDLDLILGALRQDTPARELVQSELFRDPLVLVARAGHPLAARRRLTPGMLAAYPWVAPRDGAPSRASFDALHGALPGSGGGGGVPPPIETGAHSLMVGLLLASDRLTLISAWQVEREVRDGLLCVLALDLPDSDRPIGLTMRADWAPSLPQARFIEILAQVVHDRRGHPGAARR